MGAIRRRLVHEARSAHNGGLSGSDGADVSLILVSYVLVTAFKVALFVVISRVLGPTQFGIFAGPFAVASAFSTPFGNRRRKRLLMAVSRERAQFPCRSQSGRGPLALSNGCDYMDEKALSCQPSLGAIERPEMATRRRSTAAAKLQYGRQ
jgi:hypothetical protein